MALHRLTQERTQQANAQERTQQANAQERTQQANAQERTQQANAQERTQQAMPYAKRYGMTPQPQAAESCDFDTTIRYTHFCVSSLREGKSIFIH